MPFYSLGSEGYEELTLCMKSILQEMKDLETNGLTFSGRHLKMEWLVLIW